jgi:hypothetical protein
MLPIAPLLSSIPSMIGAIGRIVGGEKGRKLEEAVGAMGEVTQQLAAGRLPPEQQAALRTAMLEHEGKLKQIALERYRLDLQDAAGARDVIKMALTSEDAYVRRARPTFLWIMYVVLLVNFVVFPMVGKAPVDFPDAIFWLFGTAFLGYGAFRSLDKRGLGLSDLRATGGHSLMNILGIRDVSQRET